MAARKAISKSARFRIFNRDKFTCQYCGRTPPSVTLEVDHVTAVSRGGTNDDFNLVTACYDCNRGKSNRDLSSAPSSLNEQSSMMAERVAQMKAMTKAVNAHVIELEKQCWGVVRALYGEDVTEAYVKELASIKMFLGRLSYDQVIHAATVTSYRKFHGKKFPYFCGVCWNMIREGGGENA